MKRPFHWYIVLAIFAILAGCFAGGEEAPPYPILDSGVPASTNDRLYWLDNDRVIFVSYGQKFKSLEEAQTRQKVPSIHIWDTRTNKVTLYKNSAEELCYDDGYIVYAVVKRPYDAADPARWYAGPMGQEQEVDPPNGLVDFSVLQNPHTCRWVERPEYARGHTAMPLREEDGWLVHSKPWNVNEPGEWLLYRSDGSVVKTGIPTRGVRSPTFVASAGNYFLEDTVDGRELQQIDCHPYWWLKPTGEVLAGCQDLSPIKGWYKGSVGLTPTPLGILVSAGRESDFDRGTAGLYLTDNGQSKRIDVGESWSPDGCKSAHVDVPGFEGMRVGGRGDVRLKMTDVCANKGR